MKNRKALTRNLVVGGVFALMAASILWNIRLGQPARAGMDAKNAELVALGRNVYAAQCASCHGANLEGQLNWRTPNADGSMPAPPHDVSGHTWHHPDAFLFQIVKEGGQAVSPQNSINAMPAFGQQLSDREIWAVLSFIKSTWPPEIQEAQEINAQG